ncbi:hypothetical protein [Pectobacterium phage PPWS2]|uniref:Uncharacterized protein n=1 Tax=Pectobacterium phage PPWS2 TaxID=2153295 RepID=A0A3G9EJ80_9CAUD|nr:hypothetical protein HOU58_gp21 [Pectobacterium phage PPWS2]BBD74653.1 hypothetical protein [Pectobacterium phage PPWS2]
MKVVVNTSSIKHVDRYTACPGMVCVRDSETFFVVDAGRGGDIMFVNVKTGFALPRTVGLRFELRPDATLTV